MIPARQASRLRTSALAVRWGPLLLWMALIFWSCSPSSPPRRAVGLSDHLWTMSRTPRSSCWPVGLVGARGRDLAPGGGSAWRRPGALRAERRGAPGAGARRFATLLDSPTRRHRAALALCCWRAAASRAPPYVELWLPVPGLWCILALWTPIRRSLPEREDSPAGRVLAPRGRRPADRAVSYAVRAHDGQTRAPVSPMSSTPSRWPPSWPTCAWTCPPPGGRPPRRRRGHGLHLDDLRAEFGDTVATWWTATKLRLPRPRATWTAAP